jgi:hypothetical protein
VATTNLPMYELGIDRAHRRVIFASSLGTVFESYDFYLDGSLAAIISKQFFSGVNEATGFIFALLAFAAGFAVSPFRGTRVRSTPRHDRPQIHLSSCRKRKTGPSTDFRHSRPDAEDFQ